MNLKSKLNSVYQSWNPIAVFLGLCIFPALATAIQLTPEKRGLLDGNMGLALYITWTTPVAYALIAYIVILVVEGNRKKSGPI